MPLLPCVACRQKNYVLHTFVIMPRAFIIIIHRLQRINLNSFSFFDSLFPIFAGSNIIRNTSRSLSAAHGQGLYLFVVFIENTNYKASSFVNCNSSSSYRLIVFVCWSFVCRRCRRTHTRTHPCTICAFVTIFKARHHRLSLLFNFVFLLVRMCERTEHLYGFVAVLLYF